MTLSSESDSDNKFVPVVLPWLIATLAFLVYLLTMNHWVSMGNLAQVGVISGWNWQPDVDAPLYWAVTLPFRLLSPKTIPLALNLLSVACATLTLRLLARSVALLPHDRTEEQRLREKSPSSLLSISAAWVPPLLAAVVCGLQLTFWQLATVASREMFDLLLFAYVVRCILEYRVSGLDSWLFRAALVYGAGMAENWAMIGFFPLFLVALVWLRGVSFFNARFLGRMFAVGSIGLCAYLVLPLVDSFTSNVPLSFWQALRMNLASQKQMLLLLPFNKGTLLHGFTGDQPLWVLALPSLLPVLALSIRWPSYFGDPSKLGVALATLIFHVLHAVLLVVCVWVALDPEKFSPRHLLPGLPLMTLYYLGALSVGYYVGYFLLVFGGAKPQMRPPRPVPPYQPLLNFVVTCGVVLLVLIAPAALLYRNLPQIRIANGPMWRQYADLMVDHLPAKGAVLMSDDQPHLLLVEAALAQRGRDKEFIFLDTRSLRDWPIYHKYLSQRYPGKWPTNPPPILNEGPYAGKVNDLYLVQLATKMAETNSTYYLHPSFGYYFEVFYPEAQGLVYKLQQYPVGAFARPPLLHDERMNEGFWRTDADPVVKPLLESVQTLSPDGEHNWVDNLLKRAHLLKEPNSEALYLATLYSRDLDDWGVTMQRNGLLTQAASHFDRALELNPENVVAQINLECNNSLREGRKTVVDLTKAAEERLAKFRTLEYVMNANGPFDEPTFCFEQGRAFLRGGNYRQAGQELIRVKELVPDNIPCRVLLARIYLLSQMTDQALALIDEIHKLVGPTGLDRTNEADVLSLEMTAQLVKGDTQSAEATIRKVLEKYPQDEQFLVFGTQNFMNFGYYSNALPLLNLELRVNPTNSWAFANKGVALLRLNRFQEAIPPLSESISLEGTNNFTELHFGALLNRAIAYLHTGDLTNSQQDYQELQRRLPTDYRLDYGLGEIAYRLKETNAALLAYGNYMKNAPTNAPGIQTETDQVVARLKELKATSATSSPSRNSNSIPPTATNQSSKPGK